MRTAGIAKFAAWLLILGALAACASAAGNKTLGPSVPAEDAVHAEHALHEATASASPEATPSPPSPAASPSSLPSPSIAHSPAPSASKPPESSSPAAAGASLPPPEPSPPPSATEADQGADDKAASVVVEIRDFAFSPAEVKVAPGTKVKFINRDEVEHSAVADDGTFDTGMLGQNKEKEIDFPSEGTFTYYCNPHTGMKGKIVVASS